MKIGWRWYGQGNDDITLDHIRQIPGVEEIIWSLHDKVAGEPWEKERIEKEVSYIRSKGFGVSVVESVNIHDDIKIGLPSRERYIDEYIQTIEHLAGVGVEVICYNFMPIFDWTRTDLYRKMEDGSTALFYENAVAEGKNYREMVKTILDGAGDKTVPGWEPERLANLEALFEAYAGVDEDKLFENLGYFLHRIMPTCDRLGVKMAMHNDDPAWPIFGLPRLNRSRDHIKRVLQLHPSVNNGLTLCTGSLGSSPKNDIPAIIREFGDRIHFGHVRNVKRWENGDFIETSHRACDGDVDTVEVMKAYHEIGFTGCIRPDHGRHLWGEESSCRPGYGLYDRALGIMYLLGIWDTLHKK